MTRNASRGIGPTGSDAATNASACEQIDRMNASSIIASEAKSGCELAEVNVLVGTNALTVAASRAPITSAGAARSSSKPAAPSSREPRHRRKRRGQTGMVPGSAQRVRAERHRHERRDDPAGEQERERFREQRYESDLDAGELGADGRREAGAHSKHQHRHPSGGERK